VGVTVEGVRLNVVEALIQLVTDDSAGFPLNATVPYDHPYSPSHWIWTYFVDILVDLWAPLVWQTSIDQKVNDFDSALKKNMTKMILNDYSFESS